MDDNISQKTHSIDNSIRDKMALLDKYSDNFFSEKLTIITDFTPYVKYVQINLPARTPEHRIVFVRRGTKVLNVSFRDYKLKTGSLLLIPAGSVLINKEQSEDYNVHSVAFRIPKAESLRLVDFDVMSLQLSSANQRLVDNYISLMHQLACDDKADSDGIDFLIVSLLYILQEWNHEQNESVQPERQSRAAELSTRFVRMITSGGIPQREPAYYADKLGVTKGYLSQIVMNNSGKTVMEWINEKTLLEAKLLLSDTDKNLEDIAEDLHLNSASQFIKFFQKRDGETPNAYRKRAKKIAQT